MNDITTTPPPPPPTEMVQAEDFNAKLQNQQTNTTNTTNTNAASQIPPEQLVQYAMVAGNKMMEAAQYTGNQNLAKQAQQLMQTAQGVIDTQGNPYLLQQLYSMAQGGGGGMGMNGMVHPDPYMNALLNIFNNSKSNLANITNSISQLAGGNQNTTTQSANTNTNTTTQNTNTNTNTNTTQSAPLSLEKIGSYDISSTGKPLEILKSKADSSIYTIAPKEYEQYAASMDSFPPSIDINNDGAKDTLIKNGSQLLVKIAPPSAAMTTAIYGEGTYIQIKGYNLNGAEGDDARFVRLEADGTTSVFINSGYALKKPEGANQIAMEKAIADIEKDPKNKDKTYKIGGHEYNIISYKKSPEGDGMYVNMQIMDANKPAST
jgi:hypothetical protein